MHAMAACRVQHLDGDAASRLPRRPSQTARSSGDSSMPSLSGCSILRSRAHALFHIRTLEVGSDPKCTCFRCRSWAFRLRRVISCHIDLGSTPTISLGSDPAGVLS